MLALATLALAPLFAAVQSNDPASLPTAPKVLWTAESQNFHTPEVGPNGVCLAGPDLRLLDLDTGEVKARVPAFADADWTWVRLADDGTWVAGAPQHMARFSDDLSTQIWSTGTGKGWPYGQALTDELVIGNNEDGLVARNLTDGSIAWKSPVIGKLAMVPAVDAERVYVGTQSGTMLAFALADGHLEWTTETGAQFGWTNPVAWNGLVFMGDRGIGHSRRRSDTGSDSSVVEGPRAGALNAFDAKTGERKWSTIFGATGFSLPAVDAATNTVWAGFGRSVASFDIATGELQADKRIRTGSNAFGTPRVIGDRVAFGNLDNYFYVYDRATRKLKWALHNPGEQVYGWVATDGKLLVNMQARVMCLVQDPGANQPVPEGTVIELAARVKPEPKPGAIRDGIGSTSTASPASSNAKPVINRSGRSTQSANWVEDLHSLGKLGEERRTKALAGITAALGSTGIGERAEALFALASASEVAFDRDALRKRVVELTKGTAPGSDVAERIAALNTLSGMNPEEADIQLVLDVYPLLVVSDRWRIARLLATYSGMDLREGPAAKIMLELAQNPEATGFAEDLGAVWGARVSDPVAEAFIDMSRSSDHGLSHKAIYFGLSTFMEKSPATVERLIEVLADPDWNNSGRALWGLSYGVPVVSQQTVVDAMLDMYANRNTTKIRERSARIIRDYGGEDRLNALLDALDNPK